MLTTLIGLSDKRKTVSQPDRLQLLENAVINYGGGIVRLESRARGAAESLHKSEPEAAQLLNDIVRYLRDVAAVGKLDIVAWQEPSQKWRKYV